MSLDVPSADKFILYDTTLVTPRFRKTFVNKNIVIVGSNIFFVSRKSILVSSRNFFASRNFLLASRNVIFVSRKFLFVSRKKNPASSIDCFEQFKKKFPVFMTSNPLSRYCYFYLKLSLKVKGTVCC